MGPKKKKQEKKKQKKPPSSSNCGDWSCKFDILLASGYVRYFKWEILNFSHVNAQCIFSDYFELWDFRFRFLLFPKGQESRNATNKQLSLHLERADNDSDRRSCFIRSKISVVNHEDYSSSVWNSIFHRFLSGSGSHGQIDQFVALNSLLDPENGFLLNGTDLHIQGDVIILCETQLSRPVAAVTASASDGISESSEGTYCGHFGWFISNYSYFEEAIIIGMLRSDPIKIGETWYHLRVCSQTVMDEEGEKHLSISVELQLEVNKDQFRGEANAAWFAARFFVWSQNQHEEVKVKEVFGRINKGLVIIGKISEIIIPENVLCFGFYRNYFQIYFDFTVLKEKEILIQNLANSKNIWNFGEGPKATSTGKKKLADKIFAHFSWEIRDFLWTEPLLWKPATCKGEIWSKIIRLGQNDFCMMIFPFGRETMEDSVGAFLTFFESAENKSSLLVHYRLNVHNQKGADENTREVEHIERFPIAKLSQVYPLVPKSTFYTDSSGYIVEGRAKFDAYIHVLEETFEIREVLTRNLVKWKVDNFLAWEAIRGHNFITSGPFKCNRCILRMEVGVADDGTVIATMSCEPSLAKAGEIYQLSFYVAVINQKKESDSYWEKLCYNTNEVKFGKMGKLSDILKEGAGFVVNDKVFFGCEIISCEQGGPDLCLTLSSGSAVDSKPSG